MITDIEKRSQSNQESTAQKDFGHIDLKKYFENLGYLTEKEKSAKTYRQLRFYTQLDSNKCCDFALIGKQNQTGAICPEEQKTGYMLAEEIFLNPLLDIACIQN